MTTSSTHTTGRVLARCHHGDVASAPCSATSRTPPSIARPAILRCCAATARWRQSRALGTSPTSAGSASPTHRGVRRAAGGHACGGGLGRRYPVGSCCRRRHAWDPTDQAAIVHCRSTVLTVSPRGGSAACSGRWAGSGRIRLRWAYWGRAGVALEALWRSGVDAGAAPCGPSRRPRPASWLVDVQAAMPGHWAEAPPPGPRCSERRATGCPGCRPAS